MPTFFTDSASFNNVQVTGSTLLSGSGVVLHVIGSGSTIFSISGSSGEIFSISDSGSSTNVFSVSSGSTTILQVDSSKNVSISGSLIVTGSITGSLFGTSSWAISSSGAITASHALTASFITSSNVAGLGTAAFLNNGTGSTQVMTVSQSDNRYRNPYLPIFNVWTGSQANSSNTVWQTVSESILYASSSGYYEIEYVGTYDSAATTTGINLFVTRSMGESTYVSTVISADVQSGDRSTTAFNTFTLQDLAFASSRTTSGNWFVTRTSAYFTSPSSSTELIFKSEINTSAVTLRSLRMLIRKITD